jgi:hypothetical protein
VLEVGHKLVQIGIATYSAANQDKIVCYHSVVILIMLILVAVVAVVVVLQIRILAMVETAAMVALALAVVVVVVIKRQDMNIGALVQEIMAAMVAQAT